MKRIAAALLFCLLAAPALAGKTYGLVVGIDDYVHIPKLDGAVNDAKDITDALLGIDAEVVTLLDAQATRDNILSQWRDIANKMQDGDRLIVTYAGHGSNEPDQNDGEEADGRDENMLLFGFSLVGPGAAERIRDDEIAALIDLVPGGDVIFVADSCHSGTLSRDVNPPLGYRYVSTGKIQNDPLPPPPPNSAANDGQDAITLFLGAVDEANKVPEFMIDGQARGALSYSFANALRGQADLDENRRITQSEIGEFVRRSVRGISHGLQSPQIKFRDSGEEELLVLDGAQDIVETQAIASVFDLDFDSLAPVSVFAADGAALLGLIGVVPVAQAAEAELVLSTDDGQVRTSIGDRAGFVGSPGDATFKASLQAIVDKFRVIQALQSSSGSKAPEIQFASGDGNYRAGDVLTVQVSARATEFVSLFNLASDGAIAFLYPLNLPGENIVDPQSAPPADQLGLGLQVVPPFGSDHVIAIETSEDPALLRRVLASHSGSRDIRQFWSQLRQAINALDQPSAVAQFAFQTVEN